MCTGKNLISLLLCLLPSVQGHHRPTFCLKSWLLQTLHEHSSLVGHNTQWKPTPVGLWRERQELPPHSFSRQQEPLYIKCILLLALMQNVSSAQSMKSQAFAFDSRLPATKCKTWLPPHVGCRCSCWYAPHEPTNMLVHAGAHRMQSRTTPNNRSGWQRGDSSCWCCVTCPPENAARTYRALGWHVFAHRQAV